MRAKEAEGEGATRNISVSGICFTSPTPLDVGRSYRFELTLPPETADGPASLELAGRVIWSRPEVDAHLVGIEITRISLYDQRRLYRFLADA